MNLQTRYKQGDVLGSNYDGDEVLQTESWLVSRNKTVTAKFSTKQFDSIWDKQYSLRKSLFVPVLQSNSLLHKLSDQRLNLL